IAYSEGRFLRIRPIDGGPIADLPPGEAQIRSLSWSPDSREVLTDGYQTQGGLAIYDRDARTRRPFTAEGVVLRTPAWSPDGSRIAAIVNDTEGQELRVIARDGSVVDTRRLD